LAATQLFGGVSPELLWSGLAATLLTVVSLTSLTLWLSVHARRPRDAIILAYLVVICYYAGGGVLALVNEGLVSTLGPSAGITTVFESFQSVYYAGNLFVAFAHLLSAVVTLGAFGNVLGELLIRYAIFHGVVTLICTVLAAWRVRSIYIRQRYGTPIKPGGRRAARASRRAANRHVVSDHPMLWKEVGIESRFHLGKIGIALFALLVLLTVGSGIGILGHNLAFASYREMAGAMNIYVRTAGTALAILIALVVGVRASASIGSERERQTLDGLLASPLETDDIVGAKWWGSLVAARWLLFLLFFVWLLGLISGGLHIFAMPLLLFLTALYATFMASLGLAFAAACKTTGRAIMWTIATALFIGGGHWLCCLFPIAVLAWGSGPGSEWLIFFEIGLTPPAVLAFCAFQWEEFGQFWGSREADRVIFFIMGILAYLAAAVVLRFVAAASFYATCGRIDGRPRSEPLPPTRRIERSA
jgi:ABC-type transport system involved in multi-copper enzyme maturation permease subunit